MKLNYSIDGNQVCATQPGFDCLGSSLRGHAGFGSSLKEAYLDYYRCPHQNLDLRDCRSWELEWGAQVLDERERS